MIPRQDRNFCRIFIKIFQKVIIHNQTQIHRIIRCNKAICLWAADLMAVQFHNVPFVKFNNPMYQGNVILTVNFRSLFHFAFFIKRNQIRTRQKLVCLPLRQRIAMSQNSSDTANCQSICHDSGLAAHLQTVIPEIVRHPIVNVYILRQPLFRNTVGKTAKSTFNDIFAAVKLGFADCRQFFPAHSQLFCQFGQTPAFYLQNRIDIRIKGRSCRFHLPHLHKGRFYFGIFFFPAADLLFHN